MMSRRWAGKLAALACAASLSTGCGGSDAADEKRIIVPLAAEPDARPAAPSTINHLPRIVSLRLQPTEPVPGDQLRAIADVEDIDGDKVSLDFLWRLRGQRIDHGGSSYTLADAARGDSITVEVTASDGRGGNASARDSVSVRNQPPVLIGVALNPAGEVSPGEPVVVSAQGRDPDGDALSYTFRWNVNGEPIRHKEAQLETQDLDRGDEIQAFVTASDGEFESPVIESIVVKIGNANPEITSNPVGNWADGQFRYQLEANDPDQSGPLRYALRSGPDGMTVDPVVGMVSWSPDVTQVGEHPVAVAVTDAQGATAVQSFELTVGAVEETAPANASN